MFALSGHDAEYLALESRPFDARILREQTRGQFLARIKQDGITRDAVRMQGFLFEDRQRSKRSVIRNSRTRFGRPRAAVERKLSAWLKPRFA